MKISAQEEYGLRILIRIASCKDAQGISIPQLSEAEGLSTHYVAKFTRALRHADFITSTPGNKGGYFLAKEPKDIIVKDVLTVLGGNIFDMSFCDSHAAQMRFCTNSVDCAMRSLWKIIQLTMDKLLIQITLDDLLCREEESSAKFHKLVNQNPVI